jgi:hypothetical protein
LSTQLSEGKRVLYVADSAKYLRRFNETSGELVVAAIIRNIDDYFTIK